MTTARPNPAPSREGAYLALGRAAAVRVARANGAPGAAVAFPDADSFAPVRIRVAVARRLELGGGGRCRHARGRRRPSWRRPGPTVRPAFASGGGYDGPLAYRQGKPMRPDVAQAFDRMAAAARGGRHRAR